MSDNPTPETFTLERRTTTQDGETTTTTDNEEVLKNVRMTPRNDKKHLVFQYLGAVTFEIATGEVIDTTGDHFEDVTVKDNDNITVSFTHDFGPGGETTTTFEFEVEW